MKVFCASCHPSQTAGVVVCKTDPHLITEFGDRDIATVLGNLIGATGIVSSYGLNQMFLVAI